MSKFEIDRPNFDGSIDIKFFRSPLLHLSLLPSLLFFSLFSSFSFLSYPYVFVGSLHLSRILSHSFFFLLLLPFSFFFFFWLHSSKPSSTSHVLWESGEVGDICGYVGTLCPPLFNFIYLFFVYFFYFIFCFFCFFLFCNYKIKNTAFWGLHQQPSFSRRNGF